MKLISMTDFVLEQYSFDEQLYRDTLRNIVNYANFLKQPLNLGMFVPCDEDGNVLKNPFAFDEDAGSEKEFKQIQYNNAKEKVLFEGFCINGEDENIITLEFENTWIEFYKEHEVFMCDNHVLINIEDLSNYELQLTESAIKQIGL